MKDNEQHAIDTTVRQALENLEMPYIADHWQLMGGKLDALHAQEAEFDNNFADKLRGIETSFVADHWQQMANKLEALDAEETAFDNNFAEKLGGMEVPYQASHWTDMSTRLDELEDSETNFDALLSQRLENLHVKYQPSHWNFMAQQIEETFSWRAKVVKYKLIEVALVLLTLFTVGNMLDLPFDSNYSLPDNSRIKVEKTKGNDGKKTLPNKVKEIKSFNNPTDLRGHPASSEDTKSEKSINKKPIAVSNNPLLDNSINTNNVQLDNILKKEHLGATLPNYSQVDGTTNLSSSNSVTQLVKNTEGGILKSLPIKKVSALGKVFEEQPVDNQSDIIAATMRLNPVDILKPKLLDTHFYDENITFPIYVEKKAKWRLNIFGLPIADMISYNYNKSRAKITENQIVSNLGAGVAFGYKNNNLEVETGLSYLDKKYYLPNVEFISGNFRGNYKVEKPLSIRLSILSIPLSTNYTFKETHRWRFYTRLGMALNTIWKSKEELFVESSNTTGAAPANTINNYGQYEPNVYPKGILEKGFFKDGVWLNGGLKKNTYITANAGIGVEYRLTHKMDVYLQPTYDYHFSKRGIGTLDDRINSFSVQGGVKMKLK